MMTKPRGNRICSVGRTMEILGDKWIFLILREAFFGVHYYDDFRSNLGIATNILSNRLKALVLHGILDKEKDENDARRIEYRLSKKGIDLYGVTLTIMQWGDKWLVDEDGPPLILYHNKCGHRLKPYISCSHCHEKVSAYDVSYESGHKPEKGVWGKTDKDREES